MIRADLLPLFRHPTVARPRAGTADVVVVEHHRDHAGTAVVANDHLGTADDPRGRLWIDLNPLLDRVLAGELGFAFGRQHVHQPIAEAGMLDDLATIEGVGLSAVRLRLQLVDEDLVKRAHHRQHDLRLLVAAVEAIAGTDEPHLRRLDQFAEPQRLESITVHPTEVVDDEPGDASIRPPCRYPFELSEEPNEPCPASPGPEVMSNIGEILMATRKVVTEGFLRHPPAGQSPMGLNASRMAAA